MYVVWDVKTVSSAWIGPYTFGSCTVASSWRDLVDTEKVITRAWRQCIPSKLHETLAQEYGITSQKIVILNYPVGTPQIISNDFYLQQPYHNLASLCSSPRTTQWPLGITAPLLPVCSHSPLPSVSQTTTCTKANDESLGCATVSDLEICSSKAALGTTTTNVPTDQLQTRQNSSNTVLRRPASRLY